MMYDLRIMISDFLPHQKIKESIGYKTEKVDKMKEIIGRLPSDSLNERGAIKLQLEWGQGKKLNAVVIRYEGKAYAWMDYCPHWGTGLGGNDEEFWTRDKQALICQVHQAQFRPDDGYCTLGPCQGQSLKALPLEEENGVIKLFMV